MEVILLLFILQSPIIAQQRQWYRSTIIAIYTDIEVIRLKALFNAQADALSKFLFLITNEKNLNIYPIKRDPVVFFSRTHSGLCLAFQYKYTQKIIAVLRDKSYETIIQCIATFVFNNSLIRSIDLHYFAFKYTRRDVCLTIIQYS